MRTIAQELVWDHWGDWSDDNQRWHRWKFPLDEQTAYQILCEGVRAGVDVKKLEVYFEVAAWRTSTAVQDGIARNPIGLFRYLFRQQLNR